ncbi:MAG: MFS transporter [Actinobacteria bacterium]|nr:MAG: MFS transporter [Actinomycetota bacterium]
MLTRDLKLIFASIFALGFGYGLYFYLAPIFARQIGATAVQVGIIYTTFYLVTGIVAIPGGLLADRYNLYYVIVFTWIFVIPTGFLYYFAQSWVTLVVANVFGGLSMMNSPAIAVYITKKADPKHLARSFTLVYSSFAAGMILSPALGGFIAQIYNIRIIFLIASALFVISIILISFISKEEPALSKGEGLLLPILRDIRFIGAILYFSLIFFIIYISQPFLMPFLQEFRDFSLVQIGFLGAVSSLGAAIIGPFMGHLADIYSRRVALIGALFFVFLGVVIFLSFSSFAVMLIAFIFFGVVEGFYSLSGALISSMLTDLPSGLAFGVFRSISNSIAFIGPFVGGLLFEVDLRLPFFVSGVSALILIIATYTAPFLRDKGMPFVQAIVKRPPPPT